MVVCTDKCIVYFLDTKTFIGSHSAMFSFFSSFKIFSKLSKGYK